MKTGVETVLVLRYNNFIYDKSQERQNFMLNRKLDKILPKVQKPGRDVGGELNSVIKNK